MKVSDLSTAADRFKTRAAAASGDYQKGVATAGQAWKDGVTASTGAWAAGVADAASRNAFGKAVSATDPNYYASRARDLGGQRFAQGVQAGAANWQEGFQPYAQVLSGITLDPRGPKGDPRNFERARTTAAALRAAKVNR